MVFFSSKRKEKSRAIFSMLLYKNRCFSFSKTLLPSQQILSPLFCSFFFNGIPVCLCARKKIQRRYLSP
jgi:hypothetical protein